MLALARAVALGLGLLAAGLVLRRLGPGLLHAAQPTLAGAGLLVLCGGLLTASGVPRQMVAFTGGYLFGPWLGGGVALLGQMFGCLIDLWLARTLAAERARRLLTGRRLALARDTLLSHPFGTTLMLRLLPVSSNVLVNLLAGAACVPVGRFLAATLVGYLPQTLIFSLLGSGAKVGRAEQIAAAAALFVLSACLGLFLYRRRRIA